MHSRPDARRLIERVASIGEEHSLCSRLLGLGIAAVAVIASVVVLVSGSAGGTTAPLRRGKPATGSSASAPSTTAPPANGEASKAPQQVLADAAAALRAARGYELSGTAIKGKQRMQLQLIADSSLSLEMAAVIGPEAYQVLRTPNGLYVRANAAFWSAHLGARATVLANRWIHTPVSPGLSELGTLAPATMARCLTENHGTLSIAGQAMVNGQSAVILKDAGDLPGSQPGTLAVAANGPPVPLRFTSTGHQRPGGHIDVCHTGSRVSLRGILTFSHFNQVQPIQPPLNAIQLPGGANA